MTFRLLAQQSQSDFTVYSLFFVVGGSLMGLWCCRVVFGCGGRGASYSPNNEAQEQQ